MEFADRSMEAVAYFAYWASTELAEERGPLPDLPGLAVGPRHPAAGHARPAAAERGGYVEVDRSSTLDWEPLRERIKQHGMRNSNCIAIAPTATIANIIGVSASIEPTFQNLYVKSNLSGEFTVVNEYLVSDLKRAGLWDEVMIADLKYFDGNLARIDRVPAELRRLYATAFEVEPKWLVEAGARRQKWIDQSQSLNIYMAGASGKKLDETYKLAWLRGLKTTYYLRAMGATHAEKSTVKAGALNAVPSDGGIAAVGCGRDDRGVAPTARAEVLRDRQPRMRSMPVRQTRPAETMLNFDEEGKSERRSPGLAHASRRRLRSAAPAARGSRRALRAGNAFRRIKRRGQAHHQRQGRRQPAGAVQVQVGLGEVPRRLRQPLDAAGNQHEPRHRAVEGSRTA